ncbi:MAG: hypothetical protein M1820_001132 [Bogoriella megaspora]|nr:MAG: hypothetical protein M1820_001132 [Bogoriella megaspora]
MCASDIFLGLIAVLFPPLAVWVKRGLCSADSLINLALCCLGYFPGLIHAWYIISLHPEPSDSYERVPQDPERGSVTYYYVQQSPSLRAQRGAQNPGPKPQAQPQRDLRHDGEYQRSGQMGYGTMPAGAEGASAGQSGRPLPNEQSQDVPEGVPPSYQQAIQGDNKVQHD